MQHPKLKNYSIITRGLEGVAKKCGKQEEGMPLYFDSHKISDKKPDKFLDDDFKGMAK